MRDKFDLKSLHFKSPAGPKTSGHVVDFDSFTYNNNKYIPWVTKLNKHEGKKGQNASALEVVFSEIATLFIKPGLTPAAKLVREEGEILGVGSAHFKVQINDMMHQGKECFQYNPAKDEYTPLSTIQISEEAQQKEKDQFKERAEGIDLSELEEELIDLKIAQKGVHFLDKMPQDFFKDLLDKHNSGEVVIDMESLATIFAASYALEEDDLHKGNIGFYINEIEDFDNPGSFKKQFTFFKIDHDLMFNASIMSRQDMRLFNILYTENSFKITVADLERFPDLVDSENHYWPTKKVNIPWGDKAYKSEEERQAFASLKTNPEFIKAKWEYFLKFSLISPKLIEQCCLLHLDPVTDSDRIGLVKQAAATRINELKQTLLSCPGFLDYLKSVPASEVKGRICAEIKTYLENSGMNAELQQSLYQEVENTFEDFVIYANQPLLTPLSKQIITGCYDGKSSKNSVSIVDVERAFFMYQRCMEQEDSANAFKYAWIVQDLIKNGKNLDFIGKESLLSEVEAFKKNYISLPNPSNYNDFVAMADKIRLSDIPLKQQKQELLQALKLNTLPLDQLYYVKIELKKGEAGDNSLKFIHQMRSELWIVRKLVGLYGKTSTANEMINEIDNQIKAIGKKTTQAYKEELKQQAKALEFEKTINRDPDKYADPEDVDDNPIFRGGGG